MKREKKKKKSHLRIDEIGGKCRLWSCCSSRLGADYYFYIARVQVYMHKVAAGRERGPVEMGGWWWDLGCFGKSDSQPGGRPLTSSAPASRGIADSAPFNPTSVDRAPTVYRHHVGEGGGEGTGRNMR